MRDILRELPQLLLVRGESLNHEEFIDVVKSSYATKEDLELSSHRKKMISEFQTHYWDMARVVAKHSKVEVNKVLLELTMRTSVINKYDRVTGDSISTIVDKVINHRPRVKPQQLYNLLQEFCDYQNFDPDKCINVDRPSKVQSKFIKNMLQIVREYREGL